MLWMIAVIMVFLWLLGFMSSYTMGGFIHILLVIAALALLIGITRNRRIAGSTDYNGPE